MEHPQHCQHLAEQIAAETDEVKCEKLRAKFREECQDSPVTMSDEVPQTFGDDPHSPAPPPPPKK